jgi:hypothetical protein
MTHQTVLLSGDFPSVQQDIFAMDKNFLHLFQLSAVMRHLKKNKIKIPDLSLPPCIIFRPNKIVLLSFR